MTSCQGKNYSQSQTWKNDNLPLTAIKLVILPVWSNTASSWVDHPIEYPTGVRVAVGNSTSYPTLWCTQRHKQESDSCHLLSQAPSRKWLTSPLVNKRDEVTEVQRACDAKHLQCWRNKAGRLWQTFPISSPTSCVQLRPTEPEHYSPMPGDQSSFSSIPAVI
jgi:hypothetical protein